MPAPPRVPPVPAVLRLVQMVVLGRWRATGEDLYREVSDLLDAKPGHEIVVSGAGEGETSEWLAAKTGASITGVDPDEERIERAEARARELKNPLPLSYQECPNKVPILLPVRGLLRTSVDLLGQIGYLVV